MTKLTRPAVEWAKPAKVNPLVQSRLDSLQCPPCRRSRFWKHWLNEEGVHYGSIPQKSNIKKIFPEKKGSFDPESDSYWVEQNTFHRAIGPVLIVGQCFGVLPVSGLLGPDASHLKFSWRNWRVAYSLVIMSVTAVMLMFSFTRILVTSVDIYKTISLMFYVSAFTSLVLFLRLAPQWPALGLAISQEETRHNPFFLQSKKTRRKRSLKTRFSICCFCVLFFALVEHVLSIMAGLVLANDCPKNGSITYTYFINAYPEVFYFLTFSGYKAAILQPINFTVTFNWNFIDLFIIVMSIALTDRLEILGDRLEAVTGKDLPQQFWRAARAEFSNLAQLVRKVDKYINEIVLLSFANNLYFICLQLFNSLKPLRRFTHIVYFVFSFGFLMTRSLVVALGAARIHSAARRPATVLYAVPSESYTMEVRRFLDQVSTDVVALTGLNFFYVTRGLILTIAGTIVTYELVLVQFNAGPTPVTTNITVRDRC